MEELLASMLNPPTTPRHIDPAVKSFCKSINPKIDPFILATTPEDWSRADCCHLNVQHYIRLNGETMVCGYRIWYLEKCYIEAERHAVWRSDYGSYRDVSFNVDGETSIVFVPDIPANQNGLGENELTVVHFVDSRLEQFRPMLEQRARNTVTMPDDMAWQTCQTYADYKKAQT